MSRPIRALSMILGLLSLGVAIPSDATTVLARAETRPRRRQAGEFSFPRPTWWPAPPRTRSSVSPGWTTQRTRVGTTSNEASARRAASSRSPRPGPTTSYDLRLTQATTYYYRVQALRKGYPTSDYSNVASVITLGNDSQPPTVPTGVVAGVAGCRQIDITWASSTDTGSGLAGYQIYRDGSVVGSTTGNIFSDSTLSPLSTHSFNVVAYDHAGDYSPMSYPSARRRVPAPSPTSHRRLTPARIRRPKPSRPSPSAPPDRPMRMAPSFPRRGFRRRRDGTARSSRTRSRARAPMPWD